MTKKFNYVIKNIHTNDRFPGVFYAEVWKGEEIYLAATLDMCVARIKDYLKKEDQNATDRTRF